ncbi:asparaginase [Streptomyces sp. NPDC098781]|uniref:asparaginase n=1 Tax=Streptomyces sp. NPDC098781 TaxID=3366097 RepID=UPI0038128A7E
MMKPRIAVGSLGGTITMTSGRGVGITPALDAGLLLSAVPGLGAIASLEAKTLAALPGASLGFDDVLGALAWARGAVDDGAQGVVLVQGTDTLEETAYLLDLFWNRPEPLVVTGAMRSPEQAGADGPANLMASVRTAAHPASRDLGVLVSMNDEVHAAARVAKSDSMGLDAFRSPVFGPLARLVEGVPVYGNRPPRHPFLPFSSTAPHPRVALLTTHLADRGELLDAVMDVGCDGVVLAAFGAGHVPAPVAEAVGKAAGRLPVVLATRTGAGPTAEHTYGFVGSETDLISRGAVPAGWLSAAKARLLLWSLLRLGCSHSRIRAEFALRGGNPGGPDNR